MKSAIIGPVAVLLMAAGYAQASSPVYDLSNQSKLECRGRHGSIYQTLFERVQARQGLFSLEYTVPRIDNPRLNQHEFILVRSQTDPDDHYKMLTVAQFKQTPTGNGQYTIETRAARNSSLDTPVFLSFKRVASIKGVYDKGPYGYIPVELMPDIDRAETDMLLAIKEIRPDRNDPNRKVINPAAFEALGLLINIDNKDVCP